MPNVVPPEIIPFFNPDDDPQAVPHVEHPEGIRTRIMCGLSRGQTPVEFSWFKDGRPLHLEHVHDPNYDPDLAIDAFDPYSSVLKFERLRAHHSAEYRCEAVNAAGRDEYTAKITVRGKKVSSSGVFLQVTTGNAMMLLLMAYAPTSTEFKALSSLHSTSTSIQTL